MSDPTKTVRPWVAPPTTKAKNAVRRAVTSLLDELAPERVVKRVAPLPGSVEQHRTPTGCVLQGAAAAISVSWFASTTNDAVLGELHVIVWRGIVAQRGANEGRKGATIVSEMVLLPIEPAVDDCIWQANDGTRFDTPALAARCLALLEEQIRGSSGSAEAS